MRRSLRGAVGLAAVVMLALAALPSGAAPAAERSLLGIKIWRSWRDVLAKYGQPTRIEIGAVTAATPGGQPATGVPGIPGAPGLPGMPGMESPVFGGMGGADAGPRRPRMGGMGGGATPSGGGGSPYGGSYGGGYGSAGQMGAGSNPYGPGYGMPGGMGAPPTQPGMGGMPPMGGQDFIGATGGMGGGAGIPGIPGMPGRPGMPGMGGTQGGSVSEAETTWVYEKGANTNYFLYNKDGRVIQIQSFGYKGGGVTARGLRLGDPVSRVYQLYGWPDSSSRAGDSLTLDYSTKYHAAFQLTNLHNGKGMRVVGITVALTEKGDL